ncbi:MAG: CHAD domain-containing protein [Gammaproteobacteria bacterium]
MSLGDYSGYLLPPGFRVKRLVDRLSRAFRAEPGGESKLTRLFLDSFDWRLWQGGVVLSSKRTAGEAALLLQRRDDARTLTSARTTRVPAWPADIPPGELRERVAALVEMRVLLPLVSIDSTARVLRVLNDDDKTVVRLRVEEMACHAEGLDEPRSLLTRLVLVPVRGYAAELRAVERFLAADLELPRAPSTLLDEALVAVGREPCDYSSKIDVPLKPELRADAAARRILGSLLDTLEANVEGTRADLDSEFLHDLRVATRRTRSALSQIKGVLPPDELADFRNRFGWLGQVTGPTRDMDVFLLEFEHYRQGLPEALRDDLEPLRAYLQAHQRIEQQALRRKLDSPHFRRLLKDWRAYLASDLPAAPEAANALRRIDDLAGERIWRMYRRVIKEGRGIDETSPPAALHELRKSCKKLRYLLEFFQALYPAAELKPLVKTLKALLDNLGQFQDLQVQAQKLVGFARAMQQEGEVELGTLIVMGALVGDLLRRQLRARKKFRTRFDAFDTAEHRAAYRALFKRTTAEAAA